MVKVEVITPIRNGEPDPVPPGAIIEIALSDAMELRAIGAVRILGDTDIPPFAGSTLEFTGAFESFEDPGLIAALTVERDAATGEAEQLRGKLDAATARIVELEVRGSEDQAVIQQLRAQNAELEARRPEPVPVSIDMKLAQLRGVAAGEGVLFDDNDTKAELVTKIEAGRATARAEA